MSKNMDFLKGFEATIWRLGRKRSKRQKRVSAGIGLEYDLDHSAPWEHAHLGAKSGSFGDHPAVPRVMLHVLRRFVHERKQFLRLRDLVVRIQVQKVADSS
jgi:hypothetical protein